MLHSNCYILEPLSQSLSNIRVNDKVRKVSLDHNILDSKHNCQVERRRRIKVSCSYWDILIITPEKTCSYVQ